ncbi:MAG: flippase-like domain-containing protein [Anaerolineales bacterium]|nr:flippase-like domain-containing protein [Anaerolineales bacterium]
MRKFLFAVALLLGVIFVIGQLAEVEAIMETFKQGDWRFLFIALCIECIWFVNVAASYKTIFSALGLDEKIPKLILISAAASFINIVAPTAGMGGMAIFISEAKQSGNSPGKVTVAGVLFVLFDYLGILSILILGLFVLFRRNNLNITEILATAILWGIALTMVFLMYLGMRSSEKLGNALAWMARMVNRILKPFIHREYLSENRAHEFAIEAGEAIHELSQKPDNLVLPAILGLTNKLLLLSIFALSFLAYKIPLTPGTLVAGFSIGYLFLIVSPTPAGIGVVEGVLALTLRSLYVPLGAAATIVLTYRGITFWVPLLFGFIALRILSHRGELKTVI